MRELTILTTTYNREKLLPKLYNSLCIQTNSNFKWLIIDDGSNDNTKNLIEKYIKEKKIKIYYYYIENGGKHRAINYAMSLIDTPLVFIVDSDDYLTNNAVDRIDFYYNKYKDYKGLCGYSFLRKYENGQINNKKFPKNEMIESFIDARINRNILGDKAEVFYTKCLKEYPFPEYENEKFLSEAVVWIKMAEKYKMVHINEAIYVGEYLDEGLTKNIRRYKILSPKGYMDYAKALMNERCNILTQVKGMILYSIYGKFDNKGFKDVIENIKHKLIFTILYPFSLILYNKWKRKIKK